MNTLRLLLSGDSILQRRLQSHSDPELKPLFDKVRSADVAFTNLEVLANDYRGDPALESGGSHFGAPSWVLDELTEAGFSLFATATNHCLDYSISGLVHSIEAMEARGLSFEDMRVEVEQVTARNPYRIAEFSVRVVVPRGVPAEYAEMLDRVARSCPAHNTLAHAARISVAVDVPDSAPGRAASA